MTYYDLNFMYNDIIQFLNILINLDKLKRKILNFIFFLKKKKIIFNVIKKIYYLINNMIFYKTKTSF